MSSTMTRRALLRWGAVGAGAMVLAACAPKQAPAEPAPKEEAPAAKEPTVAPAAKEEAKPAAAGAITLRFMTRQGDAGVHMREFGKRYADESEGKIVVEFEEAPWDETPKILETQLISGTMVDATWGDTAWWPNMARRGAYLDIEEYVAEAGMNLDDWFNVAWFRRWTDGKLSGLGGAAGFHPGITFYNKEWVVEAWGKEPTDDWTLEDFTECINACAKLKGEGYFGGNADVGGGHGGDGWLGPFNGGLLSQDGTQAIFAEPEAQDGIKWQIEQLASKAIPTREDQAEGLMQMFLNQKLATYTSNPGASQGMSKGAEENNIDMGVVLSPKGPSASLNPPQRGFCPYANTFGAYSKTKYPREAFGLIARVTSEECMKWLSLTTGKQPGALLTTWYDSEVVEKFPWFPKCADVMKTITDAFACPANTRYNEWRDVGNNEIPAIVYGDVEYTDANVQAVNDHMQEVLDLPMPGA